MLLSIIPIIRSVPWALWNQSLSGWAEYSWWCFFLLTIRPLWAVFQIYCLATMQCSMCVATSRTFCWLAKLWWNIVLL